MAVSIANIISEQNLKNGLKLVKFQFESHLRVGFGSKFHILTSVRDELDVSWKVTDKSFDNYWMWEEISLEMCSRNISFNIMILANGKKKYTETGDMTVGSPPLKHSIEHELPYCKSNKIIVMFDIIYNEDDHKEYPTIEPAVLEKYDELFDNKKSSDVVFVFAEDQEISAHTLILSAQSEVFAAMFDSDMMEKNTGRVEIIDIEMTIFKQLLRFIYSGKIVSEDTDELLKLILAANKYSVNDLVAVCARRLSGKLSVDNALEILIIADQVNADVLKKDCISVIVKNKKQIIGTPNFQKLRKSHKDLALQLLDFFMEEE